MNYDEILNKHSQKIAEYNKTNTSQLPPNEISSTSNERIDYLQKYKYYILPIYFIFLFVLICIFKPSFTTETNLEGEKVFKIGKAFLFSVLGSIPVCVWLIFYDK